MNKRKLRLEKYGISSKRYKELCGFCEQYPEWKMQNGDHAFITGMRYSDMPGSPNRGMSDKTSKDAIKLAAMDKNCDLIERVARLADAEIWQFIIKSVCYEVPVNYLITVEGMNMSPSAFYERRRYFFYLLDKEKG